MSDFDLPKNWELTKLGNLAEYINGRAFKPTEWQETGKPIIRIQNLNNPNAHYNFFSGEIAEKYHVHYGDLLYAWSASLDTFIWKGEEAFLNQHIFNVKPYANISKLFIFYLLKFVSSDILSQTHGSGMVHITKGKFDDIPVSLPPLNEQNRIVAKIEALFSEIDNGIDSLSKAKFQLEQYRQSLLKSAFEGKLTEQWRADYEKNNGKPLPTADELLKQIQDARQAHYDQQLAEWELAIKAWEENGKEGRKPTKPNNEFLKISQKSDQYLLDEIWKNVFFEEVYDIYVGSTPSRKNPDFWNGSISWVSSGEVNFSEIFDTKEKITKLGLMNASTKVHPAGTVMLAMIGEGKTRGQASILRIEACHNQNTSALRVNNAYLSSKYLYYFLKLNYELTRRIGGGNNQKALNKTIIQSMKIPICSYGEQREIVEIIDTKLTESERVISEINVQLKKSQILKSAILQKAFQGKLVSQDDNDPPASELLEQIKQEREQALALIQEAKQAKKADKPKTTKRTKKAKTTEN